MHGQGLHKKSHQALPSSFSLFFPGILTPGFSDLLWVKNNSIYFSFPALSKGGLLEHAVFTRLAGASNPPYKSLNIGDKVGDRLENVSANLLRIKEEIGAEHLVFMNQRHGHEIVVLRQGRFILPKEPPPADAMITDIPGLALMVKQADCQGIIILDPGKGIVANVHCGWRGNVQDIAGRVVSRMKEEFGCISSRLIAAIGPSLGPCCGEFISHKEIFPESFGPFMIRENYFDLWAVTCGQLLAAGLREENIEVAGICTRCRTDLFYSYRGEGRTGRFGTVAMLR